MAPSIYIRSNESEVVTESLLYGLFLISRASWALLGFGLIIGSSLYDWRAVIEKRRANRQKAKSRRPLVTIIVTGELKLAEVSLQSAAKASYSKLEIILALNRNSKAGGKLIKKLAAAYTRRRFKLIILGSVKPTVWQNRLKRSVKGKVVVGIESGTQIQDNTIDALLNYLARHPRVDEVVLRRDVANNPTLRNLVYEYSQPVVTAINKCLDIVNRSVSISGPVRAWRADAYSNTRSFSSQKKSRRPRIQSRYHHAAGVTSALPAPLAKASILKLSEDGRSQSWLKKWYGLLLLLEPLIIGYSIFTFVQHDVSAALISSWIISGATLLLLILGDEQLSLARRGRLLLLLPTTIFLVIAVVLAHFWRVISTGLRWLMGLRVNFRQLVWQRR